MFIVIAAILLTASTIMGGVLWRLTREEHRRSGARVATLASDLAHFEVAARDQLPGHPRFAVVLAVGGVAVATALALIVVTSRNSQTASGRPVALTVGPVTAGSRPRTTTDSAPLELLALGHEREGNRLIVRGVVRNPKAGVEQDRVAAVVFLFNGDGSFLAGGLATVEVPALKPGSQSGFIVAVPNANGVGRYHVSFRSDDRMVPHVDRRVHGPIAPWQ